MKLCVVITLNNITLVWLQCKVYLYVMPRYVNGEFGSGCKPSVAMGLLSSAMQCRKHANKYFVTYLFGFGVVIMRNLYRYKVQNHTSKILFMLFVLPVERKYDSRYWG